MWTNTTEASFSRDKISSFQARKVHKRPNNLSVFHLLNTILRNLSYKRKPYKADGRSTTQKKQFIAFSTRSINILT